MDLKFVPMFYVINYPDRYMDEDRGRVMWERVMQVLEQQFADSRLLA